MTQPQPGRRFDFSRLLDRRVIALVVAGLVTVAGLGVWVAGLAAPAVREGRPTMAVSRPAPRTPTPTPSLSGTPTPSADSAGAEPTPTRTRSMRTSGDFDTSTVPVDSVSETGELRTYIVRVETSTKLKVNPSARDIAATLNDPRGWAGDGSVRFTLVEDPEDADFTVWLSSPKTAAAQCDSSESGWACATEDGVVVNALAWSTPPQTYAGDVTGYRRYLVNHGIGHYLGEKHAGCSRRGRPAPVMQVQATDLDGCRANPWPNG